MNTPSDISIVKNGSATISSYKHNGTGLIPIPHIHRCMCSPQYTSFSLFSNIIILQEHAKIYLQHIGQYKF